MNHEKADVRLEDVEGTKAELDRKAQKMLEDKDADSRMRIYEGPLGKAIVVLLCVWTAFQLYFTTVGAISAINLRAIHCIFFCCLRFFYFLPIRRRSGEGSCRRCGTGSLSWGPWGLSFT